MMKIMVIEEVIPDVHGKVVDRIIQAYGSRGSFHRVEFTDGTYIDFRGLANDGAVYERGNVDKAE